MIRGEIQVLLDIETDCIMQGRIQPKDHVGEVVERGERIEGDNGRLACRDGGDKELTSIRAALAIGIAAVRADPENRPAKSRLRGQPRASASARSPRRGQR
jgi:hypothetical protein